MPAMVAPPAPWEATLLAAGAARRRIGRAALVRAEEGIPAAGMPSSRGAGDRTGGRSKKPTAIPRSPKSAVSLPSRDAGADGRARGDKAAPMVSGTGGSSSRLCVNDCFGVS